MTATDPSFPEDLALAKRLAARDAKAWEEAVRRFTPLLRAVAQRTLGASALAEDATEMVFVELLAREEAALRLYQGRAPLGAYLAVLARRTALRTLEEDRRHRLEPEQAEALCRHLAGLREEGGEGDLPDLQGALGRLPSRQAYVLHALYAERREIGDLARELGCAPSAVSTLAWRARVRLGAEAKKNRS